MQLPRRLSDLLNLFDTFDWERIAGEVEIETRGRIAIVGPVNSGKSTLFNLLKGKVVSPVAAVPGPPPQLRVAKKGPLSPPYNPPRGERGRRHTKKRLR